MTLRFVQVLRMYASSFQPNSTIRHEILLRFSILFSRFHDACEFYDTDSGILKLFMLSLWFCVASETACQNIVFIEGYLWDDTNELNILTFPTPCTMGWDSVSEKLFSSIHKDDGIRVAWSSQCDGMEVLF